MSWQTVLIISAALFAIGCFLVSDRPHNRRRRGVLPPPSARCDRSTDAGWWT